MAQNVVVGHDAAVGEPSPGSAGIGADHPVGGDADAVPSLARISTPVSPTTRVTASRPRIATGRPALRIPSPGTGVHPTVTASSYSGQRPWGQVSSSTTCGVEPFSPASVPLDARAAA